MKVEAHLGANYDRHDRYEFKKSSYPHRKSRIQPILLINRYELYIYIHVHENNTKSYTVLFSMFMKVEANLDANYSRNGRYEFKKSYYPHRKSRTQPILLINRNKLYLYMYMNTIQKVILYYFQYS